MTRLLAGVLPVLSLGLALSPQRPSDQEADKARAPFILIGTVQKTGASAVRSVPASDRTVTVKADRVVAKPKGVSLAAGDVVTIELTAASAVAADKQYTFYAAGWVYGSALALREVAHGAPITSQIAAGPRLSDGQIMDRVRAADVVIAGQVVNVRTVPVPNSTSGVSEHNAVWYEAVVKVASGIKNAQDAQTVVVRFPTGRDVRWSAAPQLTVGQNQTFFLHRDQLVTAPRMAIVAGSQVPAFTALDPMDVLPAAEAGRTQAAARMLAGGRL